MVLNVTFRMEETMFLDSDDIDVLILAFLTSSLRRDGGFSVLVLKVLIKARFLHDTSFDLVS